MMLGRRVQLKKEGLWGGSGNRGARTSHWGNFPLVKTRGHMTGLCAERLGGTQEKTEGSKPSEEKG